MAHANWSGSGSASKPLSLADWASVVGCGAAPCGVLRAYEAYCWAFVESGDATRRARVGEVHVGLRRCDGVLDCEGRGDTGDCATVGVCCGVLGEGVARRSGGDGEPDGRVNEGCVHGFDSNGAGAVVGGRVSFHCVCGRDVGSCRDRSEGVPELGRCGGLVLANVGSGSSLPVCAGASGLCFGGNSGQFGDSGGQRVASGGEAELASGSEATSGLAMGSVVGAGVVGIDSLGVEGGPVGSGIDRGACRSSSEKEKKKEERRQKNKRRRYNKKKRQCERSVSVQPPVFPVRRGYFSELDSSVQRELKESRARLLIEKNRLDLARAKEAVRVIDPESPEYIVKEMIRVTGLANNLKKKTADAKIGGWAETVADSLTKSVAEGAPSSVPTLESVGYGKSALRSSDGSVSERATQYEERKVRIAEAFDLATVELPGEREEALEDLKVEFADVVYDPATAASVRAREAQERFVLETEVVDWSTKERLLKAIAEKYQDMSV